MNAHVIHLDPPVERVFVYTNGSGRVHAALNERTTRPGVAWEEERAIGQAVLLNAVAEPSGPDIVRYDINAALAALTKRYRLRGALMLIVIVGVFVGYLKLLGVW